MSELADALRRLVAQDFEDAHPAHDLNHLDRVYGLAQHLHRHEGGDRDVIVAASYLHDFHRLADSGARERIQAILAEVDFPTDKRATVLDCVRLTRSYSFAGEDIGSLPIEARIVRDADNLDAIGAIGIARAFMFGGLMAEAMWAPHEPVRDRYESGRAPSVIHHFFEKLLKLRDDMQTDAGRALAADRHQLLTQFVARFQEEWNLAMHEAEEIRTRTGDQSAVGVLHEADLRI
jgi:uncharacterized protein